MAAEWLGPMLTPLHFIRRSGGGHGEELGKGVDGHLGYLGVIWQNWKKDVMMWIR